jgi:hypothetical protein
MACALCGDPGTASGLCGPCADATDKLADDLNGDD